MKAAFTLVEVLLVMAIILVLSGLILAVREPVKRSILSARTQAIAETVRSGILAEMQGRGGGIVPAEHPVAASAAPRRPFRRAVGHAFVVATGQAYWGAKLGDAAAVGHESTLLLDDDICADPDAPSMYGLRRGDLGVLGVSMAAITDRRLLPSQRRAETVADASGQLAFYRLTLGNDTLAELVRQKAVWTPPDDSNLIDHDRLWSPPPAGAGLVGSIRLRVAGVARAYRLRGPMLYDAWGNEFLLRVAPGGSLIVMSAGPDGHFRWHPGDDGVFSTDPWLDPAIDAPGGDDRRADRDNVVVGMVH